MFPFQSRRAYGHLLTRRTDKPKISGNEKACDIFYDPEGDLAAPSPEGNLPGNHADLDVHMDDWESNKEQIAPKPLAREENRRVHLNPRRPSAKKGARALHEMSLEVLYPNLATDLLTGKSGAPNMKGATAGIPPTVKTFKKREDEFLSPGRRHRHENGYRQLFNEETVDREEGGGDDQEEGKISMGGEQRELLTGEAQSHVRSSTGVITTSSTNSEGGTFRVPAVPGKHFPQADSGIDPAKRDILSNPLPPREIESVSEANGKNFEPSQDAVEENKENQQPETFFCGVDPNNDKGFPADSPFGSDLAHLLTPYAQESILENDLFSKLREPISVSEAMAISGESEPGTTPIIREGALGELSAEHLYLTEPKPRELVYIPSEGLPCRYDSSENFVPTLTIESALKDIRTALSNFDAFEIWEDSDGISGEGQKDKAIAYKVKEIEEEDVNNGDSEDESELNDDEYEALLQLHFGNGFSENIAENPSQGTIVVRSQASARVSITYNNITESRRLVEDNIGSCSPPSKFCILHRSPVTDRDDFDGVETGDNAEAVAHRGTVAEHASDENTPPRTDVDPFIAVHSDKTETPPDSTSIILHALSNENHSPALKEKTSEILPQKSSLSIIGIPPLTFPRSPSGATPALSPLTVHSPPNPNIPNATASTLTTITDIPSMPIFPASLKRSNSFREFRDPLVSAPISVRFGSLQSASSHGTNAVKLDGTGGHDNEEKLSQLNLI